MRSWYTEGTEGVAQVVVSAVRRIGTGLVGVASSLRAVGCGLRGRAGRW
jgi:hypothetical protein